MPEIDPAVLKRAIGDFTFVEISDHLENGDRNTRFGSLRDDQVGGWLRSNNVIPKIIRTRILLPPFLGPPRSAQPSLTFSYPLVPEPIFHDIISKMDLPSSYARTLSRGYATSRSFTSRSGSAGFILQRRPASHWRFSLAATTGSFINQIFVHGLELHEFCELLEALNKPDDHQIWAPLVIPLFLIDKRVEVTTRNLENWVRQLKQLQISLENDTSLDAVNRTFQARGYKAGTGKAWSFNHDFTKTTHQITRLSSKLAGSKAKSLANVAMLGVLDAICSVGDGGHVNQFAASPGKPEMQLTQERLRIQDLKSYYHGMDLEADRYTCSADALRQTVYALIAQRDNLLNLQATEASLRIAESSRADSTSMKTIAESTAQDSASMSVITTITAVFLPGTFTAALFSTSFFNFEPSTPDHHVSPWIWLYCCITCILTIIVLAIWTIFSRRRTSRITKLLALHKSQASHTFVHPLVSSDMTTTNHSTFFHGSASFPTLNDKNLQTSYQN